MTELFVDTRENIQYAIDHDLLDLLQPETVEVLLAVADAAKAVYEDPGAAGPWSDLDAALARLECAKCHKDVHGYSSHARGRQLCRYCDGTAE